MKTLSFFKINKKQMNLKYYLFYFEIFFFLLNYVLANLITGKHPRYLINLYSEIHLVVKPQGNGFNKNIKLLNQQFQEESFEVYVNGNRDDSCNKECTLSGDRINISLRFENKISTCELMFRDLDNIIEVDLSDFDTSEVTSMRQMFSYCTKLEKINFGNINTSSVENMDYLFQACSALTSIDLSFVDTSKVTTMNYMFSDCTKLKFLDLSNFETSNLNNIEYIFYRCTSIECLNLYSFKLKNTIKKSGAIIAISSNVKYCINDTGTKELLLGTYAISNCSNECFNNKIIIKDTIITDLILGPCDNNQYIFKYNNSCYLECPNDTYPLNVNPIAINIGKRECFDKTPEGYFLDINNKVYKKCYKNCKFCYGAGNEANNNCKECITNFIFLNESKYCNNCYKHCNYYYFNESNDYNCIEKCQGYHNKLIIDLNKCIDNCTKDVIYQYEFNNNCYKYCPNGTYKLEDNKNYQCYNETPNGYYLDLEENKFKKCYESCSKCNVGGNETNNNCLECKSNYRFYNNNSNCYKNCNDYYYFDESNKFYCNENCQGKYNKIIEDKKQCIDYCKNDDKYKYNSNNICYIDCPKGTYIFENINDYLCIEEIPEGYYLENNIIKKCYYSCKTCEIGGNETYNNCLECKLNYRFYNNSMNIRNCYKECDG